MNPQERTIASEKPLPEDTNLRCVDCLKPARFAWPMVSDKPAPYCQPCLEKAKDRLMVALGAAAPLG